MVPLVYIWTATSLGWWVRLGGPAGAPSPQRAKAGKPCASSDSDTASGGCSRPARAAATSAPNSGSKNTCRGRASRRMKEISSGDRRQFTGTETALLLAAPNNTDSEGRLSRATMATRSASVTPSRASAPATRPDARAKAS